MDYIKKFQELLEELFQFNAADLDFGIYRILNVKREQIRNFINEDLGRIADEAFAKYRDERMDNIGQLFEEARLKIVQNLSAGVFLPTGDLKEEFRDTPVGRDYLAIRARKDEAAAIEEIKLQVFNDLYNFFSRYYDEGDFAPQYRYSIRGHKYAIPYNGEEVKLYWANSDQYYVKAGILFRDYAFFADPAKSCKIIFRTVAAKEELGSNKASKTRFFVLDDEKPFELTDGKILVIRFQHRELTAEEVKKFEAGGGSNAAKQEKINQYIHATVLKEISDPGLKTSLGREYKNDKPLLLYQLSRFSAKNSRDFFIHKNLKQFLSGQLDYFIKADVISIETLEKERFLDKHITRAKAVREIGEMIIDFLAQIEDFQKKLWEKKKFVLRTEYVITTDRVPDDFHQEILKNKKQTEEWKTLGFGAVPSKAELKERKLPIDTRHFACDFKERLLERLTENEDLDDLLDGLLIKSENWQGLNLLHERYREKVKCIHIDPPYNTQTSGFLYKNSYQHSSWLSMMMDRLIASKGALQPEGTFICHVDENEYERLRLLLGQMFGYVGTAVWDKLNPMMGAQALAIQHEYALFCTSESRPFVVRPQNVKNILSMATEIIRKHGEVTEQAKAEFTEWVRGAKGLTGGERAYQYLDENGEVYRLVAMTWPNPNPPPAEFFKPLIHPVTGKPCPVPNRGWSQSPKRMTEILAKGEIVFGPDETTQPQKKVRLSKNKVLSSIIRNGSRGKTEIEDMGLDFSYNHPVTLYTTLLDAGMGEVGAVLDFFAGSATTAHATMMLNNEDGGKRKFILIEMANYFDTVLIPRIKKVAYSFNWKDGKPQDSSGNGVFFKYQVLEQYEDTLDNLELKENGNALKLFGSDYLLKYFLDFETQDDAALVNFEQFKQPFSYRLKVNYEEVGEPQEAVVDLPETFHYLLGLKAKKIKVRKDKGKKYLFTLGEKEGRNVAVVWRDYDDAWTETDFKRDKGFIIQEIEAWAPQVVYVNGQSALTPPIGGFITDIRAIEPEFRKRMVNA